MPLRTTLLLGLLGLAGLSVAQAASGFGAPVTDEPAPVPSQTGGRPSPPLDSVDPVARLAERLAAGELQLEYVDWWGYLPSLLEALDVPLSSQALVFSRTSLQTDRIAPWAPRALYFNDDVYIGWVQDSPIIEIGAVDPVDGARFYTLAQTEVESPRFQVETTTCLMCHESRSITEGVPGFMVRSILVDRMGYPIDEIHRGPTTDRTPFERRWGGWYVTGTHGAERHSGNVYSPAMSHEVDQKRRYIDAFDFTPGANVGSLEDRFDTDAYLTPHSDLVSILVLAHQARIHNLIALARTETLAALRLQELTAPAPEDVDGDGLLPTTRVRITGPVERLLQTMLFVRAAPLEGPVRGTSSFAQDFEARGPWDGEGRSLRELDLDSRLFRYPMSFLVHSDAFAALPPVVKQLFARRLIEVLSGEDTSDAFAHLEVADREGILTILLATEPELMALAGAGGEAR